MKKNIILACTILLTVPVLIAIGGCKKFLDRKPLTATLDDLSQGALEAQVLGMYSSLRDLAGFSTLPWIDFHSIRDDDAQKGSDDKDGQEIVAEFDTYQYSKDDWAPNTYWNDHYAMINQANAVLFTADSLKVTDQASLFNIAEACFFRAYSYFELVKTYGDVPLFNFRIVNPTDGIRDKSPAARIYEFIDSNLQVAAQILPENASAYGPGYTGRLTKGAANTLWAQTHLFRRNWNQVIALTTAVKFSGQYSLTPKFADIWKNEGENGPESIFEMQAHVAAGAASNDALYNGTAWGTSQQVRRNGAPLEWNLGWGWNAPTDKLVNEWPESDPRKARTILYSGKFDGGAEEGGHGATLPAFTSPSGAGGLAQKFWNKKLYAGNSPTIRALTGYLTGTGEAGWINHRILRYADVLLMLAEAANESDDRATAAENLELVRRRAAGDTSKARSVLPYITPTVTQDSMRRVIKNERRWEFAMEGYRFYDLVRWGDAINVLGPLGYTNRARFYPIPQKAIDLSGGVLKQNPEW